MRTKSAFTLKTRLLLMLLALVIVLPASGCTGGGDPESTYRPGMEVDEKYANSYQPVFDGKSVLNIEVTLNAGHYAEILEAPEAEQFYSADIKLGSDTVSKVGFRTSGNTDLSEYSGDVGDRYNFKVKFDKYVDKQKYRKLDEMYLLNFNGDPSYMRMFLAFGAFRAIGGAAPLCTYATLSINGKSQGLYLAVESIDDAFLKRVFGDNNGVNLYKAGEGTDLLTTASLALLDQKNGDDTTKDDVDRLIRVLNTMPDGGKGDIESVLDVDSVLRYIAVCTGLGIYKSYLAKNPDNFYLAAKDGKFTIVPWKTVSAFGGASKDNGATAELSPYEPVYRVTMAERPLVSKLLAVDEYVTRYEGYVTAVREYLDGISAVIDTLDGLIGDIIKNDPAPFYTYEQYQIAIGKADGQGNTTGIISAAEYASLRAAYLKGLNF